ncbi:hypothetical protein MWH28_10940 [Natroniella sulfidigena]|uniref:hypothetical protein n=1 Tax=Natroniella sulfidigena TaxID=723921 RepID=UPI00200A79AD|nr:hypothetical protein [Natroniella sulfidigena]MCK8817879.1 hypothetical protein [Natroniella sulfidigena]
MKKEGLVVMLVVSTVILFSSPAVALGELLEELNPWKETRVGLIEGYLGGSNNQIDFVDDSAPGVYGGMRRWVLEDLAVGGEVEYLTIDDNEIDTSIVGALGTATIMVEESINLVGSVGHYSEDEDSSIGYKAGIEAKLLGSDISLVARGGYRSLELGEDDYSGLEFGGNLMLEF